MAHIFFWALRCVAFCCILTTVRALQATTNVRDMLGAPDVHPATARVADAPALLIGNQPAKLARMPRCIPIPLPGSRCTMQHRVARERKPRTSLPKLSLSEQAVDSILELIQLDARLVYDAAQRQPGTALALARQSFNQRAPLLQWLATFSIDRLRHHFYEGLADYAGVVELAFGPYAAEQLAWQRSYAQSRLERQKHELRQLLNSLRPELQRRVLQAAKQRPLLIPALSTKLAFSAIYQIRWVLNHWKASYGWRTEERFTKVRTTLLEQWLQQAVWLHRRLQQPWSEGEAEGHLDDQGDSAAAPRPSLSARAHAAVLGAVQPLSRAWGTARTAGRSAIAALEVVASFARNAYGILLGATAVGDAVGRVPLVSKARELALRPANWLAASGRWVRCFKSVFSGFRLAFLPLSSSG